MVYFLIILGVVLRLATHFHNLPIVSFLPHLPNFAPIAAIALFGSVYLNKKYALILPLIAMIISDVFIGFYSPAVMISVYGSFLLIGLIGLWLRKNKTLSNVIGASLFGSIIFFLITNFAMWVIPHSLYPHSLQGLLSCYTMGLPFFRNTIMGDLTYIGVLFGLMEVSILVSNKFLLKKENHGISLTGIERKRI